MIQVCVIADDYTGAADTGAQFVKKGLKTSIISDLDRIGDVAERVDALVLDTESRGDPEEIAYKKVASAAQILQNLGVDLIYKKVDSTLRGNIGVELESAIDSLGFSAAVLCPAYPKNGRITVGGFHLLNQSLIGCTEMARDPQSPVRESHIPTLIEEQGGKRVSLIDISHVSKGVNALRREVLDHLERGNRIIVIDAVSQRDLEVVAGTLHRLDKRLLICGSAGLAEELPDAFGLGIRGGRGVLVIAGTVSHVTAQQVLKAEEALKIKTMRVNTRQLFIGERERRLEVSRLIGESEKAFGEGGDVVVRLAESQRSFEELKTVGRSLGLKVGEMWDLISGALGEIAQHMIRKGLVCGMVLTGGGTAFSVYNALGALEIEVEEEILSGIPAVRIVGGKADGVRAVTKAGAFGGEDALIKVIEYLRNRG